MTSHRDHLELPAGAGEPVASSEPGAHALGAPAQAIARASEAGWTLLQSLFVSGYDELARRLSRKLRSSDLADEALQETFLRLKRGGELSELKRPKDYLYQIALNIARDRRRTETRRLTRAEALEAVELIDETPTPERVAEMRSEMAAVSRALENLPPRRRAMFLAAWVEEAPREEIAERFGVSLSTLKAELKLAREQCALALRRNTEKVVPFPTRKTSHD